MNVFSQLGAYLHKLPITPVIDVLILAAIVYQALLIVRGTRAGHILVGIFTMVGLYLLSLWLNLQAVHALLNFIVPYTALAIIVLFQTEIRRTMARIGRKRWFSSGYSRPESTDETLLAIMKFAEQKRGALIVLERDIGLRTFIESGVRLDAQLSRDLLLSIFPTNCPLHDGAVIVQKSKVAAAACFLPLSTNPTLAAELGTRHRAAVGITEETDCLSLVVSEETGRMSVASYGEIKQGLTIKEVDECVSKHFGTPRSRVLDSALQSHSRVVALEGQESAQL